MKTFIKILLSFCIIFACKSCDKKKSDLLTIPVDVNQNAPLSLSDIADEVKAIELETTDQSLIGNWVMHDRLLVSDDYILFLDGSAISKILLFDINGTFIRQIGNRGQGPGEYARVIDIAADFENNKIYATTSTEKIICYDFNGTFINESRTNDITYLHFTNKTLLAIGSCFEPGEISEHKMRTMIYKINSKLFFTDSLKIKNLDLTARIYVTNTNCNYITCLEEDMYIYYPEITPKSFMHKYIFNDTLYQIKDKALIPHLRLKFSDEKSSEYKNVHYIYRSARYTFTKYINEAVECFFCYDMKEKKGYNMKVGYIDDIHIGEKVRIRPLDSDANKFYYLHTNMSDSQKEEPNPTLYIGTLKK